VAVLIRARFVIRFGRLPTGADFISVQNISAVLLDDIGAGFEQENNLLLSRNALTAFS
jgi:hypothetical protein